MSSSTRSTLEQATSIGGICVIIGAISDLAAPIGNYKIYALGIGIAVLVIGLVLLKLKSFSNPFTQSAMTFGFLLSAISAFLLFSNPDLNVSTIAGVSDQVRAVQTSILGLKEAADDIKKDTTILVKKAEEQSAATKIANIASWTNERLFNAIGSRNFVGIEEACKAGIRARGWNVVEAARHEWDTNLYRDDEVFEFLLAQNCIDKSKFCAESVDSYVIEHATLDRVEKLCGAKVKNRYADARAKLLRQRETDEREAEADRQRKIKECVRGGVDESFCRMLNRRVTF